MFSMAATSPHTTWSIADERSSRPAPPPNAATRWRDRLADPFNLLYRYALARLLVRGLLKTRVTPSQVSAVQPVLAAMGGYLVTFGDARHVLLAAALFEARAILGCVDGTLAQAKNAVTPEGRAERATARGISVAFLYVSIAWYARLHAAPALALSAYVSTSVVGVVWMAATLALGGWLFARTPKLVAA
ncbi:MAG: hypothetical protein ACMG6S_03075 [Byssovorax sp.]